MRTLYPQRFISYSMGPKGARGSSRARRIERLALCCLAFAVTNCTATLARAQEAGAIDAATAQVQNAAEQGYPLSTSSNISGSVSIEAVLIPPKLSAKVFGKTIGNNYAAIQVTISNRSSDESLVVHSIFIDYSRWLLSGNLPLTNDPCAEMVSQPTAGDTQTANTSTTLSASPDVPGNRLQDWQTRTCPNQIASVESRVVRGQLLDEQPWTNRNWIVRALQAAGSVAAGYTFTISGAHALQSIGAYNGIVVPAAQTFWPDATIGQMNRISDLGFQVNKLIPRQSSDIVVAFFPIDRFLTPGLKARFISSPAIFFSPYAGALDPKTRKEFLEMLAPVISAKELEPLLKLDKLSKIEQGKCLDRGDNTDECMLARVMARVSLNTVRVIVGGTMTIDVDKIPAKIDSVEFAIPAGQTTASMWKTKQDLEGVIHGSFLANGKPSIENADQLGISNLSAVPESSTDKELHFKMSLTNTNGISSTQNKLTFRVAKTAKDNTTVESVPYDYQIPSQPPAAAEDKNSGNAAKPPAPAAPTGSEPAQKSGIPPPSK
jgi:hypothetical protein